MATINHVAKGQSDWQETLNAVIDAVGGGSLDLVDGGNAGITALNGFNVSKSHYWFLKYNDKKIVFLDINISPDNVKNQYWQTTAATIPENIWPIQSVSQISPQQNLTASTSPAMYIAIDTSGNVYVGTAAGKDNFETDTQAGFHQMLTYLANN